MQIHCLKSLTSNHQQDFLTLNAKDNKSSSGLIQVFLLPFIWILLTFVVKKWLKSTISSESAASKGLYKFLTKWYDSLGDTYHASY